MRHRGIHGKLITGTGRSRTEEIEADGGVVVVGGVGGSSSSYRGGAGLSNSTKKTSTNRVLAGDLRTEEERELGEREARPVWLLARGGEGEAPGAARAWPARGEDGAARPVAAS